MARELPIRNGRLTTDLDANGHKIRNLPPGEGFTQAQADWNQSDSTKPDFIKNKPTIPAPVTIDAALSATSTNPVQNKVVTAALAAKLSRAEAEAWFTEWVVERDGVDVTSQIAMPPHYEGVDTWIVEDSLVAGDELPANSGLSALPDAVELSWKSGDGVHAYTAARAKLCPTKTSDLTNDSGFLTQHQDISGKENVSSKVTALSAQSTDTQYPSAKCVWDIVGDVESALAAINGTAQSGGSGT